MSEASVQLDAREIMMLERQQHDGLVRGMTLLSTLTFRWQDLAIQGVGTAVSVGTSAAGTFGGGDDSSPTTAMERLSTGADDIAADQVTGLLGKAWQKVVARVNENDTVRDCARLLRLGLDQLLAWIKKILVSKQVIGQLVPFWGAIQGAYQGIMSAIETHGHRTAFESLRDMGPVVGAGFPAVALDAFTRYAKGEAIRAGAKSAYTFAKTIGSVLASIFSAGASSILDFVTSVVEAVTSFAYSVIQAVLFDRATEQCRVCVEERREMSVEDFRSIVKGAPFVGAVLFGAANYIGHFNLTALMSNPNHTISSSSLMYAVSKIGEAQRHGCHYVAASHFEIGFRDADQRFKWVIEMMQGYANDKPRSEILTEDATRWQRFKHKAKSLRYRYFS